MIDPIMAEEMYKITFDLIKIEFQRFLDQYNLN